MRFNTKKFKRISLSFVLFFLAGVVCLAFTVIFGGTALSSGLDAAPPEPVPIESQNLVRDNCFANFGYPSGPWGKGQYGEKGIWWNSNNADCTFGRYGLKDFDTLYKRFGITHALCINNRSPAAPHVYGTTVQQIRARPGRYRITLWAAAQNLTNGVIYVVVDRPWRVRPISLPGGNYDWRQFSGTFTTNTGEIQLRIISAGTGAACISAVSITPTL